MKRKYYVLVFTLLVMAFGIALPITAEAKNPTKVTLKPNKTYTKYDITGDKKPDKIKIKVKEAIPEDRMCNELSIIVNGKTCYRVKNVWFYNYHSNKYPFAVLYTLKNQKTFLELNATEDSDMGVENGIYQYRKGKIKKIIDYTDFCINGSVQKVKGNSLYVTGLGMHETVGMCELSMKYTYKSGTLKKASKYYSMDVITRENFEDESSNPDNYLNVRKKFTAYTSTTAKKKAFTVLKRATVKVVKCYMNGEKLMYQVKYKGKSGWIKPVGYYYEEEMPCSEIFSNVLYAG